MEISSFYYHVLDGLLSIIRNRCRDSDDLVDLVLKYVRHTATALCLALIAGLKSDDQDMSMFDYCALTG